MNNNTQMTVNPRTGEWKPVEAISTWNWVQDNIPPITGTILFSQTRELTDCREIPIVLNRVPFWLQPVKGFDPAGRMYIDLVANNRGWDERSWLERQDLILRILKNVGHLGSWRSVSLERMVILIVD